MNPLHKHLASDLEKKLQQHSIVVFYDPRREFEEFVDELPSTGEAPPGLQRVRVGELPVYLGRYRDSFFGLRSAVEGVTSPARPEPTLLYLAGVSWKQGGTPLLELERAGTHWTPVLRQHARHALQKRFSEGEIDGLLAAEALRYRDVARVLEQAESGGRASVLKTFYPSQPPEVLLATWLTEPGRDGDLESKGAAPELRALITTRLGMPAPEDTPLAHLRDRTLRYVLVNEFRSDLVGPAPPSMNSVMAPPTVVQLERTREVATALRRSHADRYPAMADRVEAEFRVCEAGVRPEALGRIDTFRCEEAMLLTWCAGLVADGRFAEALGTVEERTRSFWTDHDMRRRDQWELVRSLAELGREVERVRAELPRSAAPPTEWIAGYARAWHRVDGLHSQTEARVSGLDEEPECEEALGRTRLAYEDLMEVMARGFTGALATAGWTVEGALRQTAIYDRFVTRTAGRTAYFMVDALRFEKGDALAKLLPEALDLQLQPAVASLPSITPVGMASLLPGAGGDFNIVEQKKVMGAVGGAALGDVGPRMGYFRTRVPDLVELTLGDVLKDSGKKLTTRLGSAPLVLVRSGEIDHSGENDDDFFAPAIMDMMVRNLSRAIRKLGRAGIDRFVVTADHGYLFSRRKDEDMRLDPPVGHKVELHRRCWIGRAGTPPPGAVRVTGAELGYETDLEFIFPRGAAVFRSGGGLSYHHGGPSLQELVVPVLTFRLPVAVAPVTAGVKVQIEGVPDRVTNRIFSVRLRVSGDLFSEEAIPLRVVLLCGVEQVGQAGMAVGGELDAGTSVVRVKPGAEVNVGMRLAKDTVEKLDLVVLDPNSDAELGRAKDIPVRLGI